MDHADHLVPEELFATLNYYLRHGTVTEPIEYFHSALIFFYRGQLSTMWMIQEEDPKFYRYVTADGRIVVSKRLCHVTVEKEDMDFLHRVKLHLLSEKGECSQCQFFTICHGYFRYFRDKTDCQVFREIFKILRDAGEELKRDMADAYGLE